MLFENSRNLSNSFNRFFKKKKNYPEKHIGRFYTKDALSVWANLGKIFEVRLFILLKYKNGFKTRRIMRLDKLSYKIRLEQRTTKGSLSERIMHLVPVFILDTHNQTNYKCLPKFVQTDNASLLFKNGQLIIRFKKWKKETKKFKN